MVGALGVHVVVSPDFMWRLIYISSLLFLLFFLKPFSYSVNGLKLVIYLASVGVVSIAIAFLVGAILVKKSNLYPKFAAKWFFPIFFMAVGFGAIVNDRFLSNVYRERHAVIAKEVRGSYKMGNISAVIFYFGDNEVVSVGLKKEVWDNINVGDFVDLDVVRGRWIDYVSKVN